MSNKPQPIIDVRQEHIDLGMPENSAKCMIAEAVKAAIPGATKVHVDMQTIRYTDAKGTRRTSLTPGSGQAALVRFDAGDPVLPFRFRLPAPLHISNKKKDVTAHSRDKIKDIHTNARETRARIGGRPVPIMGNSTRRRFGIRGLRINQQGQVEQTGIVEPMHGD